MSKHNNEAGLTARELRQMEAAERVSALDASAARIAWEHNVDLVTGRAVAIASARAARLVCDRRNTIEEKAA